MSKQDGLVNWRRRCAALLVGCSRPMGARDPSSGPAVSWRQIKMDGLMGRAHKYDLICICIRVHSRGCICLLTYGGGLCESRLAAAA